MATKGDIFNIGIAKRNEILAKMRSLGIPDHIASKVFGIHGTLISKLFGARIPDRMRHERVASIIHDLKHTKLNYRQIALKHGVTAGTVREHATTKGLRPQHIMPTSAQLKAKYIRELAAWEVAFRKKHKRDYRCSDMPHKFYSKCFRQGILPWQKKPAHIGLRVPKRERAITPHTSILTTPEKLNDNV